MNPQFLSQYHSEVHSIPAKKCPFSGPKLPACRHYAGTARQRVYKTRILYRQDNDDSKNPVNRQSLL